MRITWEERVEAAIDDIRAFHAIGVDSLDERGGWTPKKEIEDDAERLGLNPSVLRKARQFADSERGYNQDELNFLCRQIKKHSNPDRGGVVFSRTHLIRLLSVPRSARRKWQAKTIKQGWTSHRLGAEIAQHFGRRRIGGHRPRIPDNLAGVYEQIESKCVSWQRWKSDLFDQLETANDADDSIGKLPMGIKTLLENATKAMELLHGSVSRQLKRKRPERELVKLKED